MACILLQVLETYLLPVLFAIVLIGVATKAVRRSRPRARDPYANLAWADNPNWEDETQRRAWARGSWRDQDDDGDDGDGDGDGGGDGGGD